MAKCYAAMWLAGTTDAVRYLRLFREYPVENDVMQIMQIYEGTNQIQRWVIANKILY
ncbi:MAG: hypothetical protein ACLR2G_12685 [Phascolarctobacterium faecium]